MKRFLKLQKLKLLLPFLGLYLLSAGSSWALFSFLKDSPSSNFQSEGLEGDRAKITDDLPKTQQCPINGMMYSEPEKAIWETRRPIAAMIENHADSRPASGLSRADVVYEAVAEGGITRFLSIFYCGSAKENLEIAPVRSARIYYIDWASEYGDQPIFMHVGGANDYAGYGDTVKDARALELLETIGWRYPKGSDFDTTYDSGYPVFWRNYDRLDKPVATEHTMTASLDEAYSQAENRGFSFKGSDGSSWDENYRSWMFVDSKSKEVAVDKISFNFWDNKPEYDVTWIYNSGENVFLRENGGEKFIDLENGKQIAASNVVVQFVKERGPVDRNLHMLYTTTGKGDALIFQNGVVIEATWEKKTRTDRTIFYDKDDAEVAFVRGQIWIEAVPAGNKIDY